MNALFIIWRECFEAVLIVGILFSYLKKQANPGRALRFMWVGVAGGVTLSVILAYGVQAAQSELQGEALEFFEVGMLILTAILMTQMCLWMKKHARALKGALESQLDVALNTAKLVGVATLTALAIAREGFEIVMFLYGMIIEARERGGLGTLVGYSTMGVLLTMITAWIYYRGLKIFNPRIFFNITTAFLLLTASGLVLTATRKLIQMDALPTLINQLWDTSGILDERSAVGQVVATITGYESTPALISVLVYALYWAITLFFYRSMNLRPSQTA